MLHYNSSLVPKFVTEGYIIPDSDGYWGTEGAKLKEDAPQWAKDEYEAWKKQRQEDIKNRIIRY